MRRPCNPKQATEADKFPGCFCSGENRAGTDDEKNIRADQVL
ncbi:hypothetical protein HMPREF3038_00434 [Akkermansia sp. KLE1797]|nr:hypothetical protein HMPREF3038_00434 [Akkermansia sp. KLE1797]KZA05422.1 hypothetical protein HMPREF1326_00828 [Akkermansia sp. KLE1605]